MRGDESTTDFTEQRETERDRERQRERERGRVSEAAEIGLR